MSDFKLTYSTMFAPPRELHERFDAALARVRGQLGQTHGLFIDGALVPRNAVIEKHNPADTRELLGRFATASVADAIDRVRKAAPDLEVVFIDDYHVDPAWVGAVADSVRAHWAEHGRGDRLLVSFHGIPQRLVRQGDPYERQSRASVDAIAAALGIPRDEVVLTFQSRFGREPWLQPYTDETLQALARDGVKTIDVVCPGFAVDCLETLEEIAVENDALFREAGGEALRYIPCLNASAGHADALATLVRPHLGAAGAA